MFTRSLPWNITLRGDGKAARVGLSIETSPAFAGVPMLDDARMHQPARVVIAGISAGPGSYVAPLVPREHTHRPMIDGHEDSEVEIVDSTGAPVLETVDGALVPKRGILRTPIGRVEGPPETITVHEPGEAPAIPTVKATIDGGVLVLTFSEPILDGAEVGIVGEFIYDLGA